MFEDWVTSVFSMVLTTDVESIDESTGDDACDNRIEVKVIVVETVFDVVGESDGEPHVTLRLPFFNPSEIQKSEVIYF